MRKILKTVLVLAVIVCILFLAACGKSEPPKTENGNEENEEVAEEETEAAEEVEDAEAEEAEAEAAEAEEDSEAVEETVEEENASATPLLETPGTDVVDDDFVAGTLFINGYKVPEEGVKEFLESLGCNVESQEGSEEKFTFEGEGFAGRFITTSTLFRVERTGDNAPRLECAGHFVVGETTFDDIQNAIGEGRKLLDESKFFGPNSYIVYDNNTMEHVGGAIYMFDDNGVLRGFGH